MSDSIDEKNKSEWNEIIASGVDGQADAFLRAFCTEFSGQKFEEVLDLASNFKKYLKEDEKNSLEEHQAHLFLEKRGETATVKELREFLKGVDLDKDNHLAYLEYCLYKWKKNVVDFFTELHDPKKKPSAALQEAIEAYRAVLAKKEAREKKMAELEVEAAKGGVKGKAAANTLAQMKNEDQLELNKAEITSAAKKRAAEKNQVDPFEEEKKRVEAEKKAREEEEARKKEEARERLKAKAKLFEQGNK